MASYISFGCNNVHPRSAFCFDVLSCPDSSLGTLHCLSDLRQPIPKRSKCRGHIVISWMFTGVLKEALLSKISSKSVSHPLNFNNFLWRVIFLLQDTRGIDFSILDQVHILLRPTMKTYKPCLRKVFNDAMLRDNFLQSSRRKLKLTAQ